MDLTDEQEQLYDRLLPMSGSLSLWNVVHLATIGEVPQEPSDVESDLHALADEGLVIRDEEGWFRIPSSQADLLRAAEQIAREELSEAQKYALRVTVRTSSWHTSALNVAMQDGCKRNTLESLSRRGLLTRVGSKKYRLAGPIKKLGEKITQDETAA